MRADPMELEVDIDRNADEVFRYLRDYSHQAEWQTNVSEVRCEPEGPANPGTLVHKVRKTPMGTLRFTVEVTDVDEPGRTLRDRVMTGSFLGTTGEWSVDGRGEGSRLRMRVGPEAHGLMAFLLRSGALRRWVLRSMTDDLNGELAKLAQCLRAG